MPNTSKHLWYSAIAQRYATNLPDEPVDGDTFTWSDEFGMARNRRGLILPPHVNPLPVPAFDPGLLNTEEHTTLKLRDLFPDMRLVASLSEQRHGKLIEDLNMVERLVLEKGLALYRDAYVQLEKVSAGLADQRAAQKRFNDAYTLLHELVEQCPGAFRCPPART